MSLKNRSSIVVADICNTLFDSNTTYDFIKYCLRTRKLPVRSGLYYELLLSKASPIFWMVAVAQKTLNKDLFKIAVVKLLNGAEIGQVRNWANEFYAEYLISKKIDETLLLLNNFSRDEIVLVSSTLEPVAEVIASNLNISKFLATKLQTNGKRYTGRITTELSGRKLAAIREMFKDETEIKAVITDNFSDKELMGEATQKFAVCYNKQQQKFWSVFPAVQIVTPLATNQMK